MPAGFSQKEKTMKTLDFRSDTVTHPTPEMREAMFKAEVGDDVYQDDPTTNRLEELAAEMLGKEAALYVASGTMGNQVALMTHTRRGQEAIASIDCHIFVHEVGAAAVLSGITLHPLKFPNGVYDAKMIEAAIRSDDIHEPPTGLICLENALANGRVVPLETMREIHELAQARGIPVHMDGARIFNAATALGVDVKELTAYVDSVSCCLSKGLCAPVGTVLCGTKDFIKCARKNRKMLGGGMRQTGVLAAAGILALTDMTKRLGEDHDNAKHLAKLLNEIPGVKVDMDSVQINMVFTEFEGTDLSGLNSWMKERGVIIGTPEGNVIRFVTHHGIEKEDVETLASLIREYMAQ